MKKSLLLAALATITTLAFAEDKTVVFDFSDPTAFGYDKPEANGTFTNITKVSLDGVDIEELTSGSTHCRFYNSQNTITLRMATGCSVSVSANGKTIKSLKLTGNNITYGSNFSSNRTTGWSGSAWTGEAENISIVRENSTLQIATMTVVYEGDGGGDVNKPITETFVASDADGLNECYSNPTTPDDHTSIVTFGTPNMDVVAVGGSTPKDIIVESEETPFTDWAEWNVPAWEAKTQGLNGYDAKDGSIMENFYYVGGTGNPVIEIGHEQTQGNSGISYRPTYVYYEPDGSLGLPKMGLYYKFTPKVNGSLRIQTFVNKGNRNAFVAKESTKKAIEFKAEGYVNGMDITVGETKYKRFLTADKIDSIHHAMKTTYTYDTTWNEQHEIVKIEKDSVDNAPHVIAGGNQNFWGWVTFDVEAGETYWFFLASAQIGFGGYDFTYEGTAGIEELADETRQPGNGQVFDLSGRRVQNMTSGNLYIQNGKKIIRR